MKKWGNSNISGSSQGNSNEGNDSMARFLRSMMKN